METARGACLDWAGARFKLRPSAFLGAAPPAPRLELVSPSDRLWKGDNAVTEPRPNVEELLSLGGGLQIQVVLADDALGVSGLEGRFSHRPELGDKHRNESMPAMPCTA